MQTIIKCRLGKTIDSERIKAYLPLFDEIVAGFNTTWTSPLDREVYYAQMGEAAARAIADFEPNKVKIRKSQETDCPIKSANRLAAAIKKAEKEWVKKHLDNMYCKLGRPIDSDRVTKYEPFVRSIIPKFLPACRLFEASMDYEDLCNQLRYEVIRALADGFDPVKAMGANKKLVDQAEIDEVVAKKASNVEQTLEKAEKRSVYERLKNYMRRVRHRYLPATLGARTVSYEAVLVETNLDLDGVAASGFVTSEDRGYDREQIKTDIEELLAALEGGCDVRDIYEAMPTHRKEELKDFLYSAQEVISLGDEETGDHGSSEHPENNLGDSSDESQESEEEEGSPALSAAE